MTDQRPNFQAIVEAQQCGAAACECRRNGGGTRLVHCPAHDDRSPSLAVTEKDGKILLHCHAGCDQDAVIGVLRGRDLWSGGDDPSVASASVKGETLQQSVGGGLTLGVLAEVKKLPLGFLGSLGLSQVKYQGVAAVRIPYFDVERNQVAVRYRLGLGKGEARFRWRKGDRAMLYGLDRLLAIRQARWVLLVEGESDCWTGWQKGLPVLGLPGKAVWRDEWAEYLVGGDVYVWQEPDAEDLVLRLARVIPGLRVVVSPGGIKDLSEAHLQGLDVSVLLERLKAASVPAVDILRREAESRVADLARRAGAVLAELDPLKLVEGAIRRMGYGGDIGPAVIAYLAATSRLLAVRVGSMLVHLLLIGAPSTGKSWTIGVVMRLLPEEAYHVVDAGSPRALIYDDADLRHKLVVFSEADSLPSGEDNPAASAVRNLLQENELRYTVVVRNPETGDFTVREIEKPGPTVLVTTAVRRLGEQLMTRLFALELKDDSQQVLDALRKQGDLEIGGVEGPDPALVAFQAYLQARAPWDVFVPFARGLADAVGRSASAPRILRDFARLLSLIKAAAVLRHRQRRTDPQGRVIAQVEDYLTVRELVGDLYADTVSGVSKGVGEVVSKVIELGGDLVQPVTVTQVANALGINKSSASRRVRTAVAGGWLINTEERRGRPAQLIKGEPLPDRTGLPDPIEIAGCCSVAGLTDGYTALHTSPAVLLGENEVIEL